MDNFVIKYVGKEHAQHLMTVLEHHYTISYDWTSKQYLCLDLDWEYDDRKFHLSMLKYVKEALVRFNHSIPRRP